MSFRTSQGKQILEINDFWDALLIGAAPYTKLGAIPGAVADEDEELLLGTNIWVCDQGLPEGDMGYQLTAEETDAFLAVSDLAWPDGIQTGLSEPVALLLD